MNKTIEVSLDKSRLEVDKIHDYLSNTAYWSLGRSIEQVKTSIEQSTCFAVYLNNEQVAFARVVSDTVVFAYLLDVFVFEEHQGKGFAKLLMDAVLTHHEFKTVNWLLRTSDAQGLYEKFGFIVIDEPATYMKKVTAK